MYLSLSHHNVCALVKIYVSDTTLQHPRTGIADDGDGSHMQQPCG